MSVLDDDHKFASKRTRRTRLDADKKTMEILEQRKASNFMSNVGR